MNNKNIQLRLNLIKRAVITFYPYEGSFIIIDLLSDGIIKLNDNGIEKDYRVDKGFVDDILHHGLSGIFCENLPANEKAEEDCYVDWKIEFYNRKRLDHVAYGTEKASIYALRELISMLTSIERRIDTDLGTMHLDTLLDTMKANRGEPATVSREMQLVYYTIMSRLLSKIVENCDSHGKNIMISPLSLVTSMAMIREGANGSSRNEIDAYFDNQYTQVEQGLVSLIDDFSRSLSQLKIANALYVECVFKDLIKKSYSDYLCQKYKAEKLNAESGNISRTVNDWVEKKTQGMIKKMIADNEKLNNIAVLNAVVFDAKWLKEYTTDEVKTEAFHNEDESICMTSMLCSEEENLLINSKVLGFMKPYLESEYYYVGMLPNEGYSAKQILKSMTAEEWMMLFDRSRKAKIDVWIPEYTFGYKCDFTETLKQLGITSVFDRKKADLSNMISIDTYVDRVVQKTYIDVNRKGTRASAVTGGFACAGGVSLKRKYKIHLDKPFIFAIVHRNTKLPIFIGIVHNLDKQT